MSYLLDTNVVSELRRRRPEPAVFAWFETVPASDIYLSVLVAGEIRQGIERVRGRDPAYAEALERWLRTLEHDFSERILPITSAIADAWGRLDAPAPLPVIDGLLAATALVHGLTLVTREAQRLERTGISLLNPWR